MPHDCKRKIKTLKRLSSFDPGIAYKPPRSRQQRAKAKNTEQRTPGMLSHICRSLVIILALGVRHVSSQNASNSLVSRRLTEYLLLSAAETHEFARVPNSNFVLLSQMSDSLLIKVELDLTTEELIPLRSFPMGKNSSSALHGVWPSAVFPGKMWLSLQGDNRLPLVDPKKSLSTAPSIVKTIDIPEPGNGPHCVFEIGNRVWAGLKVASKQPASTTSSPPISPTRPTSLCISASTATVFVKEEPTTKLIYVTQDTDSSIMRINTTSGETTQLQIPPAVGSTPVGMTTAYGPKNGLWFSLAGNTTGGSGSFGRSHLIHQRDKLLPAQEAAARDQRWLAPHRRRVHGVWRPGLVALVNGAAQRQIARCPDPCDI